MPTSERRCRPRDRRLQILAVARRLFVASGYHAVTMVDIAEQVGITPGALYRHFANKAVLLEEVVASSFDEVAPVFVQGVALRQTLADNCAAAVRTRDIGVLWSREARHLPEAGYQRLRERLRVANRFYRGLIRSERPELGDSDAQLLAWGVQAVLISPGYHSVQLPAATFAAVLEQACAGVSATPMSRPRRAGPPAAPLFTPMSQRERLLVAATRLFAEKGYQATSVGDIGAAAGVTGPSLYSYFASKPELLRAVADRGTHALWLGLHNALRQGRTAREALEGAVRSYVDLSVDRTSLMSTLTTEPALLSDAARSGEREFVGEWVALARAARPGLGERPALVHVHAALTVINSLARNPHLAKGDFGPEDLAAMAMAVLFAQGA